MATLHILFVMIIRFHTLHSQSYILQKQGLNFEDAGALCLFNFDRHLASIHTSKAWTDANSTRETYAVWIGLTLNAITNLWTYIDSTSFDYGGNPIGISPPWFTNEPNDYYGNENCVEMNAAMAGLWNDAQCSSLKYALCNYPKPIYILKDPLDYQRIPTSNHNIGYIDILDEVYVEFDVILHSYPESCATILHFGDTNISQSFPGICISGSHKFHLRFSLVSNSDPVHTTDAVNLSTLYHVTLYQTQKRLTITMNNLSVYDNETASHPIMFHRTMYFGDPWHDAADATLSNLIVTTSNSHAPNSFNYICEGWNRWTNISGSWSVSNAANTCGMHQNDETYEGAVAWLGTLDPSSIAWTDYKIQVEFTINSADWGVAGILFRAKSISPMNDVGQQYFLGVSVPENTVYFGIVNDSWLTLQIQTVSVTYGQKYTLRIEVTGKMLQIYWENEFLFSYNNIVYLFGSVALRTWRATATFSSVNIAFPSDNYLLTVNPSMQPTTMPTFQPTNQPITTSPTIEPTFEPTPFPANSTENPTASPNTYAPTPYSPTTYSPTTHSPTTSNPTLSEMTTLAPTASTSTLWTTQISSTLSEHKAAETTPFQQTGHENVYKKENKNDMVLKMFVCVIIFLGIAGGVMMIALCKKKRKERLDKNRKNVSKSIIANIALTELSSVSITGKIEENNSAANEVNINCNSQRTKNGNDNIVINASYIATIAPPRRKKRKNESIVDMLDLEGNVEIIADKTSGLGNETQRLNIRNDEFVVGTETTDDGN